MPGLLRAGVGLGPGVAEDARGAQRRRVRGHRPEGVDDDGPPREVVHARRPDEPRRAQAPRPDLLPDGHGAGRRRGPPARQITGEAEFNELFIEEARIPAANVVGGVDNGWRWRSRRLCTSAPASPSRSRSRVQIALGELVEELRESGAARDPVVRQRIAQLQIEAQVLRLLAYRGLTTAMRDGEPGPEGSLGKWLWAEVNQGLTALAMDAEGPARGARRHDLDLPLPARPRELDRGRHDRDPQEHRRRARPGAAARMR